MHFATTSSLVLGLAASSALAHMEMSFPAPFRSKFNANAGSNIDYSMTAPLKADGSDYPCKGYQSDFGSSAGASTATFAAGTTNNITIVGGAPHEGGSCQVSLSSDKGSTFTVIQSIIGDCPVQGSGNFDFEIPSDAPTGDVILAWSWHNAVGNREMYMNCAAVTITGGSSKVKKDEMKEKRATAYSSRPQIFVANVGNGCTTLEGSAVEYPSPGDDVTRNSQNSEAPSGSCGASSGSSGSGSGSGSSSVAVSSAAASTPVADPTTAAAGGASTSASLPGGVFFTASSGSGSDSGATTTPLATPEPTTLATVTTAAGGAGSGSATTTTAAAPASGTGTGSGTSGDGTAFAAGTACSTEGQWNCIGGTSFQRCASGMWSVQMALAAGTSCTAGVSDTFNMVASSKRATRRFHSGAPRRRYEGARQMA